MPKSRVKTRNAKLQEEVARLQDEMNESRRIIEEIRSDRNESMSAHGSKEVDGGESEMNLTPVRAKTPAKTPRVEGNEVITNLEVEYEGQEGRDTTREYADMMRRTVLLQQIEAGKSLKMEYEEACEYTSKLVKLLRTITKKVQRQLRLEILEGIPEIRNEAYLNQVNLRLGQLRGTRGQFNNEIADFVADSAEIDEPRGNLNRTEARRSAYSEHGEDDHQNARFCNFNSAYDREYRVNGQQTRNSIRREELDSFETISRRIKTAETIVRVKKLAFSSEKPRKYLQELKKIHDEYNLSMTEIIELARISMGECDWIEQNGPVWRTWEDFDRGFRAAFCGMRKDADILKEIFNEYQGKNEQPKQFVQRIRTKFEELSRRMPTDQQIDMIIPNLEYNIQQNLRRIDYIRDYNALMDAITMAERWVLDGKIARDRNGRSYMSRRIEETRDSLGSSESECEDVYHQRISRVSARRSKADGKNNGKTSKLAISFDDRRNKRSERNRSAGSHVSLGSNKSVGSKYTCLNCGEIGTHKTVGCRNPRVEVCVSCFKTGVCSSKCDCK